MQTACRSLLQIAVAALAFTAPVAAMAADRASDGGVIVVGHVPGSNGFGAGTIVGINGSSVRILTANHVATFGTLSVRFDDGSSVPAHIVAQFPQRDVAVIEATVAPAVAATLHTAPVAAPRSSEAVHIWGSGVDGPAEELAAVSTVGAPMPDGPANNRFALGCDTCHRGDSGGGVFNARGELVGIFVGYFVLDSGAHVSVAELAPADALSIARSAAPATTLGAAANAGTAMTLASAVNPAK
jgi:S1-C subfamily serine protease